MIYIPTRDYEILDTDILMIDFLSLESCSELIEISEKNGEWKSVEVDLYPAQEIRLKELGLQEELEKHWKYNIYPIVEEYWKPLKMILGMRNAYVTKYSMDGQRSLELHHDNSLISGNVKLNDDYEGAELVFERQNFSNKDVPVGKCIIWPSMVTHGHECKELKSGVKYSLTMWSKNNNNQIM